MPSWSGMMSKYARKGAQIHVFIKEATNRHNIMSVTCTFIITILFIHSQLFNVVVDTEETGKQLLQRGKLKRRYTIIPLNKIASRTISGEAVKRAQSLVGWTK